MPYSLIPLFAALILAIRFVLLDDPPRIVERRGPADRATDSDGGSKRLRHELAAVVVLAFFSLDYSAAGVAMALPPSDGQVVAVGAGIALVASGDTGEASFFSLETGKRVVGEKWPFAIGDATFDGEFWGAGSQSDKGILWSAQAAEPKPVTVAVPCRQVLSVFNGANGDRLFVCSPSGRITDPAELGRWSSSRQISIVQKLPAPWPDSLANYFKGDVAPYLRAGAYLIDPCTERGSLISTSGLPALPAGLTWSEVRLGCNEWLVGAEDLSSAWVTKTEGKSWDRLSPVPGSKGDRLGALAAGGRDHDAQAVYALVRREREPMHFELWVTADLGRSWRLRGPKISSGESAWDVAKIAVGLRLFPAADGIWVQLREEHADTSQIRMLYFGGTGGADRVVILRSQETALVK
jgi:hypothetical protein